MSLLGCGLGERKKGLGPRERERKHFPLFGLRVRDDLINSSFFVAVSSGRGRQRRRRPFKIFFPFLVKGKKNESEKEAEGKPGKRGEYIFLRDEALSPASSQ